MKQKTTKALSLILSAAAILSASSCVGGSQKDYESKRAAKLMKLSNVYTMHYLPENEAVKSGDDSIMNIDSETIRYVGDQMYASGYYWNEVKGEDGEETTYQSGRRLLKIAEDGTVEEIRKFENIDNYDEENSVNDWININSILPARDGSLWYARSIGHSDWSDPDNNVYEYYYELIHEDANGNEIMRFNTSEMIADSADTPEGEELNFYISSMLETDDGNLVLVSYDQYALVTPDGTLLKYVDNITDDDDSYINATAIGRNGEIISLVEKWDDNGRQAELKKLNYETGKYELLYDVTEKLADVYQFFAGEGTTIYYMTNSGLSLFDYATGETKEVLNYINSDINSNRINVITHIKDGKFLCSEYDSSYQKRRMAVMEPVSDEDVVEKYVLDFASVYLNNELADAIIDFNKQNSDYRIRFIDYSQYNTSDDYGAGITKLNNDIISGNIPDMFSLDELPLDNYISKNLIADLKKYMDSDDDFKEDEYVENILHATERDGKIYSLIVSYTLTCLISSNDYFDGKNTVSMRDFYELRKQHPDSQIFMPYNVRNDVLFGYNGGKIVTSAFLNANDGNGAFDSDEYAMWLELAKEFPEEYDWNDYENLVGESGSEYELYKNGKVMFSTQYLSSFGIKYMKRTYGDNYSFIGLPMPEGGGNGVAINPTMEIAVSAKSVLQDEAWSFIKYLLGDDYQNQTYNFSIRKDILQKQADEALSEEPDNEYAGQYKLYSSDVVFDTATTNIAIDDEFNGGSSSSALKITQEDVDKVYEMIYLADIIIRPNDEIDKIIEEEAGAYFSGKKSASDVCSLIQSRVSLYVSEDR